MTAAFSIDGRKYPGIAVLSLKRTFSVLDGDNAGRVMTGDMVRDVIGTFYNYAVELDSTELSLAEYDDLYEILSSPADFHTFVMPYGQTIYSFLGYVANGTDELFSMENGRNKWGTLSFNMIAKSPKRRPSN